MGSLVINNDDEDPKPSIYAKYPKSELELRAESEGSIHQKFQKLFDALREIHQPKSLFYYYKNRSNKKCKKYKYKTSNYHINEKLPCHERNITSTPDNHKLQQNYDNWRSRIDGEEGGGSASKESTLSSSVEYFNFIQNYVTTTLLFNYCNYLVNSNNSFHNHNRNINKDNYDCRKDKMVYDEKDDSEEEDEDAKLSIKDLDYIDCNINCNNNNDNTHNSNGNLNSSRNITSETIATTTITTKSTTHHNYNSNQHHQHHQHQQHNQQQYRNCCTSYNTMSSVGFYAASSFILVLCYLTTLTTALAVDHPIFDESSSDKEILDHLLQKSRYDKRLLPPVNDEDFCCGLNYPEMAKNQSGIEKPKRSNRRGTLTVNVNVLLLSLASPDESSLKYEVEFLLNQQWNDPRLQYGNKSQYDYLNALHHHDNIWTPDTYFIMHGDFKDPIIPMHFALRIYRNGTITYAMRRHLILSCQGSLHIFPFDDPKCSFSMESISYELSQIKYVWKNDEDTLRKSPSLTSLNAYLIQNKTETCSVKSWRGNYSCLKVDLIFTRDRAFYFTTVFIPGIILVTSSFITFWLEWNAVPARSMIGVTTMLNFFTTSNGFRSTLPVVSNLTAMNVWDGVCMCFIYASLLEFVCVNYVGRKRPLHNVVYRPGENPVTQRLPAVLSRIGVILASPLEIIDREFHAALPAASERGTLSLKERTFSRMRRKDTTRTKDSIKEVPEYAVIYDAPIEMVEVMERGRTIRRPKVPPRSSKSGSSASRSTSPKVSIETQTPTSSLTMRRPSPRVEEIPGEKKREQGGPNEIVACTSCGGGNSPCTHSANNGCATETCFVQVRKKEPPHPIRVAKTIDVIARITFPTAFAIFLIFFFVHYKGFS